MLSIPDRQLPLQNYGKPTFVQPTAQGQLLGLIGKGRDGEKVVASGHCPPFVYDGLARPAVLASFETGPCLPFGKDT